MYELVYLPSALDDIREAVQYITVSLENPTAAARLAKHIVDACEKLREFPYSRPAYIPIRPLEHEYRKMLVQNYFVFYWVDETKKEVTVARVIYAKREKFMDI